VQYEPRLGPDKITLPLHAGPTTLTAVEKSTREPFHQSLDFGFSLFHEIRTSQELQSFEKYKKILGDKAWNEIYPNPQSK
jgi:hypothetical protein